jgi:hypothetical protein
VHGINEFRKTEIHAAESLVLEFSFVEVQIGIGFFKRCKLSDIDQIPSKLA